MNKYENAIDIIARHLSDMRSYFRRYTDEEILEQLNIINELVIKERWHDIRKNPEDLPQKGERILFHTIRCCEEYNYWSGVYDYDLNRFINDDYEAYVTKGYYTTAEVIAWQYIEPYDV